MKGLYQSLPLAAFLITSVAAQSPACAWDCFGSWNGTSCSNKNGWSCLCSDSAELDTINTCVVSSCTNTTDQQAIYAVIAQACANAGASVAAAPEATFSATSGGSAWPTGFPSFANGPWYSAISTALPGPPGGWGGQGAWGGPGNGWNGKGPFGGSGWGCGPWATLTGARTGWGPWGTATNWPSSWGSCTSSLVTTTASASKTSGAAFTTITSTGSNVIQGTTFGVAVKAADSSASATATGSTSGAASSKQGLGAPVAAVMAVAGLIVVL